MLTKLEIVLIWTLLCGGVEFCQSHDVDIFVNAEKVEESGDSKVEQFYVVVVAPDVLEPGSFVNVHSWTTTTGRLL